MKLMNFIAAAVVALPVAVLAEGPAPAAAALETIAPPTCTTPELPSSGTPDNTPSRIKKKTSNFQPEFEAYQKCMKTYVDTQSELSKLHIGAANAAVAQVNAYIAEVNKAQGN